MFYSRYLKIKLEYDTLLKEIEVLKRQQDRLVYGGVHDIKGIDYSKQKGAMKVESITSFYNDLVEVTTLAREKENTAKELSDVLKAIEKDFEDYSRKCNDIEMKIFLEVYVYGKLLKDVYIKKNGLEYYSYVQIKRFHKQLLEKIEGEKENEK